jgi:hypothetical protein
LYVASLNILSAIHRFDDIIELLQDNDVLYMQDTRHDVGSPVFERLRCGGFAVMDAPRPRLVQDTSANHGGVAIVAVPSVQLSLVSLPSRPPTFELVCAGMSLQGSAVTVLQAVIY